MSWLTPTRAAGHLHRLRPLLAIFALFDLVLGGTAVLVPELYDTVMHGQTGISGPPLLARTGTLWLVFALVQGIAATDPAGRPAWVLAAGILRLMDVPADPVYLFTTGELSRLGLAGLVAAPLVNLLSGGLFLWAGLRGLRQQPYAPN